MSADLPEGFEIVEDASALPEGFEIVEAPKAKSLGRAPALRRDGTLEGEEAVPKAPPVRQQVMEPAETRPDRENFAKAGPAAGLPVRSIARGQRLMVEPPQRMEATGSVLDNQEPPPAGPQPSGDGQPAGMRPDAYQSVYDRFVDMTPQERARAAAQPGIMGRIAQTVTQDIAFAEHAERTRGAREMTDPYLNRRLTPRGPSFSATKQSPEEVARVAGEIERKGEMPIGRRALGQAGLGLQLAGTGLMEAANDWLVGGPGPATKERRADLTRQIAEYGQQENFWARMFEGAMSGTVQQGAGIVASVLTGTPIPALATIGATSFGQTYAETKQRGKDSGDALARAAIFSGSEVLSEVIPTGYLVKGISRLMKDVPTKDLPRALAQFYVNVLGREVPTELGNTTVQFLTDKFAPFGLTPEAGLEQLFKQYGETVVQTVMQSAMMTGGAAGVRGLVRPSGQPERPDDAVAKAIVASQGIPEQAMGTNPTPAPSVLPEQPTAPPASVSTSEGAISQPISQPPSETGASEVGATPPEVPVQAEPAPPAAPIESPTGEVVATPPSSESPSEPVGALDLFEPKTPVTVTLPSGATVEGTVVASTPEELRVADADGVVTQVRPEDGATVQPVTVSPEAPATTGETDLPPVSGPVSTENTAETAETAPVAAETAKADTQPAAPPSTADRIAAVLDGFDYQAWNKARDERIKTSREEGYTHLDTVPAYVETMRGKAIEYIHDPKVKGVIRTVDNHGNVYVNWSDAYSAEKEMASPAKDGRREVMRSSLGPRDLKDYRLAKAKVDKATEAKPPAKPKVEKPAKVEKVKPIAPAEPPKPEQKPSDQPQHIEGGKAEPATGEVIREAIKESAANTAFNPKEAKAFLLGEIDAALKDAKTEEQFGVVRNVKTDAIAAVGEREVPGYATEENAKLSREALETIGYATFKVPGDGTFKVLKTVESLKRFREGVEKSPGFREPAKPKKSTGPATGGSSYGSVREMLKDETRAAYDLAKLLDRHLGYGASTNPSPVVYTDNEPVDLKKGYKFFVGQMFPTPKNGAVWKVIETSTGTAAGTGGSKQKAIADAKERLGRAGPKFDELVKKAEKRSQADLEKQFLAALPPEDEAPEPPKVEEAPKAAKPEPKPEPKPEKPKAEAAPAPASKDVVQDYGEKMQGARKYRQPSLEKDLTDDEIRNQSISKIWPLSEIDAIEDKFVAAVATSARALIPTKPQKGYKLTRWVESVKMARSLGTLLTDGTVTRDTFEAKLRGFPKLDGFAAKVRLLEAIDRDSWNRIGEVREYPNAFDYRDGKQVVTPLVQVQIDGRTQQFSAKSVDEALDKINEALGVAPTESTIKFEVRGSGNSFFINKKGDPEYRKLKTFTTSKEAIDFVKSNRDDLVAAWESVKDRDNVKKTDVRREENRPRTGADHRQGKDVTAESFATTFGFRGVEFGNWVGQGKGVKERQGLLNQTYDALMDLADIVGVPPKAISLNGTLGLGFGSRGTGWASAHFEPNTLVINLTKTRGAGTLAHEWLHALDNYFARMRRDGKEVPFNGDQLAYRMGNFITQRPQAYYEKDGRVIPADRFEAAVAAGPERAITMSNPASRALYQTWRMIGASPEGWKKLDAVRPEVEERFVELVKALNESPMKARADKLGKGGDNYWSRMIELAARSFENYVITKMAQKGYQNDYLANVVAPEDFSRSAERYPYLRPEEEAPIVEAFDALFGVIETRETDAGVAMFSEPRFDASASAATMDRLFAPSESTEEQEAVARLQRAVRTHLPNINLTAVTPSRAGEAKAAQAIAEVFGKKVTYLKIENPEEGTFQGVMYGGERERVFVNANATKPFVAIAGHELLHSMERDAPDLYREYAAAVRPMMQNVEQYMRRMQALGDPRNVTETAAMREIEADFLGQNLMNPAFYDQVRGRAPSLWERFVRFVNDFLNRILGRMQETGYDVSDYFTDLQTAQAALAKAVGAWRDRRVQAMGDGLALADYANAQGEKGAKQEFSDLAKQKIADARKDQGEPPEGIREVVRPLIKDIGHVRKYMVTPRTIASFDRDFAPVYRIGESQFEMRDQIGTQLHFTADPYFRLEPEQKANVNKVLELDRLVGTVHLPGKTMSATNEGTDARLTKAGETITLSDQEKAGYWAIRRTMDQALTLVRDEALREFGLDPKDFRGVKDVSRAILAKITDKTSTPEAEHLRKAAEVVEQIEQARRTGYIPFTRWGDVVIVVKDKAGDRLWVEKVETNRIQQGNPKTGFIRRRENVNDIPPVRKRIDALKAQFPNAATVDAFHVSRVTPAQMVDLRELDALASLTAIEPDVWDGVRDELKKAMQAKGFRKHFFGSANVPGYSTDFERAVADYIIGLSGHIARRRHVQQFDQALANIPLNKERLREYAKNWVEYIQSPAEEWYLLRQIGFFYHLSGVPATAVVNATQPWLVSLPYMAQFVNPAQTTAMLGKAWAETTAMATTKNGFDMFDPQKAPPDVREALLAAWERGFFTPLAIHDAQGIAYSSTAFSRGVTRKAAAVRDTFAIMFTFAERHNRIATWIAAYRMAQLPGLEARANKVLRRNELAKREVLAEWSPSTFANFVIDETHFRMGKLNRATIQRGIGAPIMQFRGFSLQIMELMARLAMQNGQAGNVAWISMIAMIWAVAGIWGIPFADDLRKLYERLMRATTNRDVDVKSAFREMVVEATDSTVLADMLSRGITAPYGLDLSGRLGFQNTIPESSFEILGVPGSMVARPFNSYARAMSGDAYGAAAQWLPKFAANPLEGLGWKDEGVRSSYGKRQMIAPEDVSWSDVGMKSAGFTPSRFTAKREAEFAIGRARNAVKDLREQFLGRIAREVAARDRAQSAADKNKADANIAKIMDELDRYNAGKPAHEQIKLSRQSIAGRAQEELGGMGSSLKKEKRAMRPEAERIRDTYLRHFTPERRLPPRPTE